MFVGCCLSKCFLWAPDVPPTTALRLVRFRRRSDPFQGRRAKDANVCESDFFFFFPAFRATTEEVKKLDSGFLLFVLTNKKISV